MPNQPDTTPAKVIPIHDQTWKDDYLRIVGEPYSLHGWLLRLHPEDVVPTIRDLVRGIARGRIDLVYRVRVASGDYCRVRGQVRNVAGQWVGVINCLGRKDSATPVTIARHLVRSVRNSVAPFMAVLPFLEFWQ